MPARDPPATSDAKSSPALDELCRDATHITCGFGNLIIFHSLDSPSVAYSETHARAINGYALRHPQGVGMLVIIAADEPPPNETARRAILGSFAATKRSIRASVLVVEGEGFAASAKRSIIALFTMSSGAVPFPMRVAGNVGEGAEKMAQMLGTSLAPSLNPPRIAVAAAAARVRLTTQR